MHAFEPAPAPPELRSDIPLPEEAAMREVTRRRFLISAGLLTGGLALPIELGLQWDRADEAFNTMVYPGTASPIVTLGRTESVSELPRATDALLIYAGLGQRPDSAQRIAEKLADAPYKGKRISYGAYAAQGLDVPNLTDEYEAWEHTCDNRELFLNSMGSITWANVMAEKRHRLLTAQAGGTATQASTFRQHEPLPLTTLTFCSSPFDCEDVFQSGAVRAISAFGLSGTLTQKFLAKLGLAMSNDREHAGLRQLLEQAAGDTFDHLPPKMWASQICQLGATGIGMFRDSYAGAVTEDTLVMYLRPKQAGDDTVVNVDQAAGRFREFFTGEFGCRFEILEMEGAGHADIDKACECAAFEDLLHAKSGLRI